MLRASSASAARWPASRAVVTWAIVPRRSANEMSTQQGWLNYRRISLSGWLPDKVCTYELSGGSAASGRPGLTIWPARGGGDAVRVGAWLGGVSGLLSTKYNTVSSGVQHSPLSDGVRVSTSLPRTGRRRACQHRSGDVEPDEHGSCGVESAEHESAEHESAAHGSAKHGSTEHESAEHESHADPSDDVVHCFKDHGDAVRFATLDDDYLTCDCCDIAWTKCRLEFYRCMS
jgi:hypothetical protein